MLERLPISTQVSAVDLAIATLRNNGRSAAMRASERALQIERLEAAVATLRWLWRNEEKIKRAAGGSL